MAKPYELKAGDEVLGHVSFTESEDLTAKQQRALMRALRRIPTRAVVSIADVLDDAEAVDLAKHAADDQPARPPVEFDLAGYPVDLTEAEVDAIWDYNNVLFLTLAESWTLDRDLPKTADDLEVLPGRVYSAIQAAVAEHEKATPDLAGDKKFGPDGVEDGDSPTGD